MPSFVYSARGESTTRRIAADNLPQAMLRLRDQDVAVRSIRAEREELELQLSGPERRMLPAVYEQLAGMMDEGLPIGESLRRIGTELRSQRLRLSLVALADAVENGLSLSEGMGRQPDAYPATVRAAVRAGEAAGDLSRALRSVADHQRELMQMSRGISVPLVYPLIILIIAVAYALFVSTFIFPKFVQLYFDLGMEGSDFPAPTRVVLAVSRVLPMILVGMFVAVGMLYLAWRAYERSSRGMYDFGLWRLRIPIAGRVMMYTALARACSTLAMLLRGGVDALSALRLAREAAGDRVVGLALRRAEAVYEDGGDLVDGLRETGTLPEEFIFRISAATDSGAMADALDNIAADYMDASDSLVRRWVVISGPVIVIILGLGIGFTGFATFAPLIGVVQNLSQ